MTETLKPRIQQTDASPHWAPIVRPPLQEEVLSRIRQMIDDGILMPGARIPERHLCARLGISRTPLREALHILAAQGLLEVQPRRGARVKKLGSDDIDHMFQVLEALEVLGGQLACEVISDQEIAQIEALHRKMTSSYKRRDRRGFFEVNRRFHEHIVRAARNPILTQMYEGLSGQAMQVRYLAKIADSEWPVASQEHEAIVQALKARNKRKLAAALRAHLGTKRERVKALFSK